MLNLEEMTEKEFAAVAKSITPPPYRPKKLGFIL